MMDADIPSGEMNSVGIELEDLPPEILKSILSKLLVVNVHQLTRSAVDVWHTEFGSVSKYRQVSPIWEKHVDEVLADSIISMINAFRPNRTLRDFFPFSSTIAFIFPNYSTYLRGLIFYPPLLDSFNGKLDLVPGRSLIVAGCCPSSNFESVNATVNDLVVTYGNYLSVICLRDLNLMVKVFLNILGACKNVKVIVLKDVNLFMSRATATNFSYTFPNLHKLQTLVQLCDNKINIYTSVFKDNTENMVRQTTCNKWFFDACSPQIKNLELCCSRPIQTSPLPCLKQICILTLSLFFLNKFGHACSLLRLSISSFGSYKKRDFGDVFDLFNFVENFSKSLQQVHFDISCDDFYRTNIDHSIGTGEASKNHQSSMHERMIKSLRIKFFGVQSLTINYPDSDDEKELFRGFILLKFPNLCQLTLLRKQPKLYPDAVFYPEENSFSTPVDTKILFKTYWVICKKLKTISILTHVYDVNVHAYTDTQITIERPPEM